MEIAFVIEKRNKGQAESIPHGSRHSPCAFLKEKKRIIWFSTSYVFFHIGGT